MKIAILTDGISLYVVGGMQTHSAIIANQLVKANNEVDLFHFVAKNRPIPTLNEVNNIFFQKLNLSSIMFIVAHSRHQ